MLASLYLLLNLGEYYLKIASQLRGCVGPIAIIS